MMCVRLRALSIAAAIAMTAGAGAALAPPMAALQKLETGEWELRPRGDGSAVRKLCVADPRQLLQVQHAGNSCKRYVVSDTANAVVVTYDCAAAGNGRTTLRVETARLVQIQSQGVADSAPFSFAMEGRRVGACR